MSQPRGFSADVSVRPSLPEDAPTLGEIQLAAWRSANLLPPSVLEDADASVFARAWGDAIANPPTAKHRLLSACDGPNIVGFAALAPADENTGEIVVLEVHPDYVRKGHGSRLLAACTDILKTTGASHVRTWAIREDSERVAFLAAAGLAPLGVRRRLDANGTEVIEEAYGAEFPPPEGA